MSQRSPAFEFRLRPGTTPRDALHAPQEWEYPSCFGDRRFTKLSVAQAYWDWKDEWEVAKARSKARLSEGISREADPALVQAAGSAAQGDGVAQAVGKDQGA